MPIRILHIVTYMGRGGLETMLMNYYRSIDRTKVQFDFLTHRISGRIMTTRSRPWAAESTVCPT